MPPQESSRRWAAYRSSTEPLADHSEQAPAGRQSDSQTPVAWLVDRYRFNKQIGAITAIHLRNFSNSYAESIRNLTKSFQNPSRKSQKLLQFLCRIYQKPQQIFPDSKQKISETSPIPMQNLSETSTNLSRLQAEHVRNFSKSYAESCRNFTKSSRIQSEHVRNFSKSYAEQRQPELCHFQLTAARSVSTDVQKACIETDAVKHMQ